MNPQSINVLLLAAGFGTRLGSLTKTLPKALVPVGHTPLIDFALYHLKHAGLKEIFINTHHFGEKISAYVGDGTKHGVKVQYSVEQPILDTGGAIKRIFELDNSKDLLVFNCDALFDSSLDLAGFVAHFLSHSSRPIASLLLSPTRLKGETPIWVSGQSDPHLQAIGGPAPSSDSEELTFTGVHMLSKQVVPYMCDMGEVFGSFKLLYPKLLTQGCRILTKKFLGYWQDTGTPERLELAVKAVKEGKIICKSFS